MVRTEIASAAGLTDPYENNPYLEPQDVADAVVYVLGTAPHVQVSQQYLIFYLFMMSIKKLKVIITILVQY